MAATGIAPMVALATPAPTSTHRAQPSQISIDDSQAKEITSLGKQNVLASHRPIELTVEIPDIGSRVRVDLSGYDSTTLLSYSRLRTLVLDVLMGRRVIDTPGDTPDEAMERRKQLATLWQYWNEGEVGLVWRRWHRLEWPHPESSISMSRILERTHTLELRRTSHYGRFIDTTISPIRPISPIANSTPTDRLRVPPPDVEGCLLRVFKIKHALATFMTRQRKHANTRRFYLATRGRFLFITTPTRLPLPKFTSTNYNENSVLVRELKDPTNSSDDSGTSAKQPALPRLAGALIDLVNMVRVNVVSPSAEEEDNQFSHHMLTNRSIPSIIQIIMKHKEKDHRKMLLVHLQSILIKTATATTTCGDTTDERSALEWQRRLQAIAQYWRQYHEYEQKLRKIASIAAGAFTHQRQQLDNHDHRPHNGWSKECYSQQENHLPATREIGRSEDYETGSIMVDTQLWPICTSLGCESIVQAGVLYRRTGRRQPAHRLFCILTNDGYLCYFDAASPSSSVASMQNRNNSSTSIQLARGRTRLHQAYIYSRCRDREINTGRARMAKLERPTSRYIGDGLYTRDSLLDCSFALWLPSRHQYFWHTNGQRGHAITFRAMDRLSTEAWVMAIQTVIDRLQSTTSNSTANDSNVTAPSTEETNLSSTSHLHDISNDSIGLQHQQQHGDDTFANLANNSTISLHD
ncbi:hypothetical protein BDF22DRAFT_655117 [Syncephalis plumigaleata]|nr:hypothetical protein BDF22DRAFT_655117 [Syncephalis plumigaleata]